MMLPSNLRMKLALGGVTPLAGHEPRHSFTMLGQLLVQRSEHKKRHEELREHLDRLELRVSK
jgi:hypothetical protein